MLKFFLIDKSVFNVIKIDPVCHKSLQ